MFREKANITLLFVESNYTYEGVAAMINSDNCRQQQLPAPICHRRRPRSHVPRLPHAPGDTQRPRVQVPQQPRLLQKGHKNNSFLELVSPGICRQNIFPVVAGIPQTFRCICERVCPDLRGEDPPDR